MAYNWHSTLGEQIKERKGKDFNYTPPSKEEIEKLKKEREEENKKIAEEENLLLQAREIFEQSISQFKNWDDVGGYVNVTVPLSPHNFQGYMAVRINDKKIKVVIEDEFPIATYNDIEHFKNFASDLIAGKFNEKIASYYRSCSFE